MSEIVFRDWEYKTYRIEWIAEVYQVDQYGVRVKTPPIYEKAWPTFQEAKADIEAITEPHPYVQDRRVYPLAPHQYHEAGVSLRQAFVSTEMRPAEMRPTAPADTPEQA
jgi:hypothetical protein